MREPTPGRSTSFKQPHFARNIIYLFRRYCGGIKWEMCFNVARSLIFRGKRKGLVLLNRLLDLGEEERVFLAEESWQDLLELPVTTEILQEGLDADACIEVKDLGFALHLSEPTELWLLLTDKYSSQKILRGACREMEIEYHQNGAGK